MVTTQPTPVTTVVRPTGDYYMTLSVVLTVICIFCGTWYSLFCTIPAIVMASAVSLINVWHAIAIFIIIFCRLVMLQPVVILKMLGLKVVLLSFWILLPVSGGLLFWLLSLHPLLGLLQMQVVVTVAIQLLMATIIALSEEIYVCVCI